MHDHQASNTAHLHDHTKVTFATLLIALGIIYGDIGTSPLYTFKAIVGKREISELLVLGGVSCIFWTLALQTTIKYVWLTLKADNQGEGGIFSLYSLVRRYGKKLVIPTMLGAAALLADGMITPAISVTSAIEGLEKIEGLKHIPVVPIVIGVISLVFFVQRFGTHKVGKAFGPIMTAWFLVLLAMGLMYVVQYPAVIRALNPYYAYELLTHYPQGFWILGAVFLCTTGAEALYSDLGHCGRNNIRITWSFVKICLVVNYLGQAAWLLNKGDTFLGDRNPFFEMMPEWFLLPGILIATLAAIVASQALISGSFTLINEAINLNFWQRVGVKQPSDTKGQIYIPSVNNILWIGCILVILYFRDSSHMEAAYGLAITLAMITTTILLSYFLLYKLKWNRVLVFFFLLVFAVIEISFFTANVVKFRDGGYITVFAGSIFFFVMYVSYFARKINNSYTKFEDLGKYAYTIAELSNDESIPKFTTHLIYLTKADRRDQIEDKIIKSIFDKKPKRADVYWFFHINRTNYPYTLDYEVSELVDDKVIKIVLNIGFRIQPKTELYFEKIIDDLIANKELNLHLKDDGSTKYNRSVDFKFIVLERYLSVDNEFALREGIILKSYFFLKQFAQKDEQAFGLDKNDVLVEHIPLVYQPVKSINLKRKETTMR
ncbi:KUP/HAK/KT family potassium transporter [Polluticaenibacter yanchengensis]|uniref:Probable potassium transport system protein Kup n=1 Tax=Polluticaenibacter yanchengensis TaxID=3014562 RepID=A0ABT4UF60_9BACT|nr:KUP/HAK/KT family potassium transporter [Chitinophagaceae bacterium LY-5]